MVKSLLGFWHFPYWFDLLLDGQGHLKNFACLCWKQPTSKMASSRCSLASVARSLCSNLLPRPRPKTSRCSTTVGRSSSLFRQLSTPSMIHRRSIRTLMVNPNGNLQHSPTTFCCRTYSSMNQNLETSQEIRSNGVSKSKSGPVQPESYQFVGRQHRCDEWSNLTPTVSRLIGSQLCRRVDNPLRLVCEGIEHHFSNYVEFEFPDPVVTIEQNFDSLLIPSDHVSRSKSDTYYVNKDNLLRSHTSAHQAECLQRLQPGQDRFFCIADVYRRDVIDGTHYPVFHQCEMFRIFQQDQVHTTWKEISPSVF